jgi:hypothetical protein
VLTAVDRSCLSPGWEKIAGLALTTSIGSTQISVVGLWPAQGIPGEYGARRAQVPLARHTQVMLSAPY